MTNHIPDPERSTARRALNQGNNWWTLAGDLTDLAERARSYWRTHHTYTVTVASDDPCYPDIHQWLLDHVSPREQRALAVHSTITRHHHITAPDDDPGEPPRTRLAVTYDSTAELRVTIDGTPVRVSVKHADDEASSRGRGMMQATDRIVFRSNTPTGRRAVLDHLRGIVEHRAATANQPRFWALSNWGDWNRRPDVPPRPIESVVLRAGQMEGIVDDLDRFLRAEADYVRRGLPWHRGILLQGPPGTGKTSVARALATRFGLDLWYAPLGDLSKDSNLLALVGQVRARSMLLLEDVDVYHATTTRNAENNQVTLSGLLNALDGAATPHGLIVCLTANNPTLLDPALVRPGRIDRVEDIDYLTEEQARRLFTFFYSRPPQREWTVGPCTSAAHVLELFKQHMDDPDSAEEHLRDGLLAAVAV
jgi:hypothetical protein